MPHSIVIHSVVRSARLVVGLLAVAWVSLGALPTAYAYPAYATAGTSRVPNAVTMGCLTCHNNTGGGGGCGSPPCLQSFGTAFRNNGYVWNSTLANMDSDGDGWTNGQELLNPAGNWTMGSPEPNPTAQARLPGFNTSWCATYNPRACSLNECTLGYDNCDTSPVASCIEQNPYYDCVCPTGYSGTGNGASGCNNINECTAGNPCNENYAANDCIDASPRYNCSCGAGWVLANDGTYSETCNDVNECTAGNPCLESLPGNSCFNTVGRFDCTCNEPGYQLVNSGGYPESCGDINECTVGNPCNEHIIGSGNSCFNATPRYNCTCGSGYTLQNDGTFSETCADVNECLANPCGVGSCNNTSGSYTCTCPSGYSFNGTTCVNVNECLSNPCGSGGVSCMDTPGSYTCTCQAGYTFNGVTCEVNNACNAGTDNCVSVAICTPIGSMSWSCACPPGYTGNGQEPRGGGTGCSDVDECRSGPNPCGVGTCGNTPGSYTCSCPTGYAFNGVTCADVNECVATPGICGAGTCTNTTGNYRCACSPGYTGPALGGTCTDVNECTNTATCNAAMGWGTCTNSTGGYDCDCGTGYTESGAGLSLTCVNLNECVASPPCGVGTCADTVGSYRCTCPTGYTGVSTGGTCNDVNECTDATRCGASSGFGACVNEPGTYDCACNAGFDVTGPASAPTCSNIDECATNADNCDENAACADLVAAFGSPRFSCTCNTGWQGSGVTCEDADECLDGALNDCSPLGTCINEVGSYGCECNEGYTGNGRTCTDVDECASSPCEDNEACFNQLGGPPICECLPGYTRPSGGGACASSCGNGERVIGEECDDGNTAAGDGCSASCEVELGWACDEPGGAASECADTCGDAIVHALSGEECDDGDESHGAGNSDTTPDACRVRCVAAFCGDGVLDTGEACDDGDTNSDHRPNACRTDCREAFCGDGVLDDGEYCDEAVTRDADGAIVEQPIEACTRACFETPDGGDAGVGAETPPVMTGGCGCAAGATRSPATGLLGLLLAALVVRRRR